VRLVAARILRDRGYSVLEVGRPADARTVCLEHQGSIDLLLTDVVMPGVSGPKLAEELTALCPNLRVLFMSGYPRAAMLQGGALRPGVLYAEKPFTPASLTEKVREALGVR
jgi:DNA-binding NtrC family response regulator